MGSEENRMLSTETQTDPVKVFPVNLEVCSVAIQTDAVEIPETAAKEIGQASENMLTPLAHSLSVSVPLQYFYGMKVQSTVHLSKVLNSMKCIDGWFVLSHEPGCNALKLVRVNGNSVLTLQITSDMCWSVSLQSTQIDCSASRFNALSPHITCITDLQGILKHLNQSKLCVGISDPQFAPVTAKCKGIFTDRSGKLL